MNAWQVILKEVFTACVKILIVVGVIIGGIWFLKQGSVIVDKGKEQGIVGR